MNERGFIAVARGILEHPVVGAEKPFCQTVAWLWLLLNAAYKSHRVRVSNGRAVDYVTLSRGQLTYSQSYLAKAWGWSEKRVRTFLSRLEKEGQIAVQTDGLQTIITVCNYDEYQFGTSRSDGQSDGQADGQRARQGREEEKGNKGTKKNTRLPSAEPEGFAEFYAAYPRKEARQAAARAYAKVVPEQISVGELLEHTRRFAQYRASFPKEEHNFCPHPASWLNGGRFLDDVATGSRSQSEQSKANHSPTRTSDEFTDGDWLDALELWRDGQPWPEKNWGPPPGQPGCLVPVKLLLSVQPPISGAGNLADQTDCVTSKDPAQAPVDVSRG